MYREVSTIMKFILCTEHYTEIKINKYISKIIYYESINFDKKERKIQSRFPLILDKPLMEQDESVTLKDIIPSEYKVEYKVNSMRIEDHIECPKLLQAIKKLTQRQREVIGLAYIVNLSDTDIAKKSGVSQQAITKIRRKSLEKLRNLLLNKDSSSHE